MLSQSGVAFEERDFFKQPFTESELRDLLNGESPRTVFNFRSKTFKDSGMDPEALTDSDLAGLLLKEPRYFKRPMLAVDGRLLAGANAKQVQAALGIGGELA